MSALVLGVLTALVAIGCGGTDRSGDSEADAGAGGDGAQVTGSGGAAGEAPDSGGWVVVGAFYPSLVRRAVVVTCPQEFPELDECRTDAECGPGAACACSGPDGLGFGHKCVPAQCRTDADCGGRACLLSIGGQLSECCSVGELGLYCEREDDTCAADDYCPGNGIACIYSATIDRFECQLTSCSCG